MLQIMRLRSMAGVDMPALEFTYQRFGIQVGSTADQTTKVQNAITSIHGDYGRGTLLLPPGDTYIGESLYNRDNFIICGAGKNSSRIYCTGDFPAVIHDTATYGASMGRCGLQDIGISYNSASYTTAAGAVRFICSASGNVWMPIMHHVNISNAPNHGVVLGGSGGYVAEMQAHDVEISGQVTDGWYEGTSVYDSYLAKVYVDGGGGVAVGYGFRILGGSATLLHPHVVAYGTNDGSGNYAGGGYLLDCNYTTVVNGHADRCASHGFVLGTSGGATRKANKLVACYGFNNGAYYPSYAANPNTASNFLIYNCEAMELSSCHAGPIGSSITNSNGYGMRFEGTTATQVTIMGGNIQDNVQAGLSANAAIADGSIKMYGAVTSNSTNFVNSSKFVVA